MWLSLLEWGLKLLVTGMLCSNFSRNLISVTLSDNTALGLVGEMEDNGYCSWFSYSKSISVICLPLGFGGKQVLYMEDECIMTSQKEKLLMSQGTF